MSSPMKIALVVMLAVLAVVPMIESTDAIKHPSGPAEVYFFAGGECIAQVYIANGGNIHPLPELPDGYTCWARNDTHEVVTSSTIFTEGSHSIIAFNGEPAPWPPDGDGKGHVHPMAVIGWVILIGVPVALIGYYVYRKKHHL